MKAGQQVFTLCLLTLLFVAAGTAFAQAQAQGTPSAPQQPAISPSVWTTPPATQAQANPAFQSACGNQPLCYDTPNFAAAVVDFRMSMNRGAKVMDATVRFVNKSNQPLILGYVDNSAVGLDDQGNRYGTYYNTGLAGIGIVSGNNADPKFTLQPGGAGDARFELMWRPGAQDPIGSTFEVGMTIREVNTLPGGQHTLGGEYPLRFQGLVNGVTGSSVAAAGPPAAGAGGASQMLATGGTAAVPCTPGGSAATTMTNLAGAASSVGGQRTANATSTASNTASNAMAQFAGLKSLFGKKNAAAPAPTANPGGGTPCVPTATGATSAVAAGASAVPATASPTAGAAPTAPATAAAVTGTAAQVKSSAATRTATGRAAMTAARGSVAPAPAAITTPTKPSAARPANIANSVVSAAQTSNTVAKKPATTTTTTTKKPATTTTTTPPTK